MQLTRTQKPLATDSDYLANMVMQIYENFGQADLDVLRTIYTDDVSFEDPLHGLQGRDSLIRYFEGHLRNVAMCRFKFHHHIVDDENLFFSWTMIMQHRRLRPRHTIRVEGSSYLKVRSGRIYYHRDYFDLGALIYENLPLIGGLIRLFREKIAA